MRNLIRLSLELGTWHAKYLGPQSDEIVALFGTDTLPTPYTWLTSYGTVVSEIQKRNPNSEVA